MAKVYFKRGLASDYGPNEPNLEDSIIFKSYVAPQFPGFSEVYLGSKLVGVGHTFGYGVKGLVPAPSNSDNGKILSTDGWTDPKDLAGLDKVLQNPISGSSQSRYPLILKGTADNTTETNSVNFSARYKYGSPILSATAGGDLFAKSLAVTELVKSPGFLVSNPDGSPISGLTAETYIKADGSGYGGVFTGAGASAGSAGLVPAPAIGDAGKYLKGDGTWGEIQGGTQSDWEEDDSIDPSYVQNRPAVRAGTGVNAVVMGDIANNVASGEEAIAEGGSTKAIGYHSHTEGYGTIAYDSHSHAEGYGFSASGAIIAPFKLTTMMLGTPFYTIDIPWDESFVRRVIYYNGIITRIMSGGLNPNDNTYWIQCEDEISTETITNAEVRWVPAASHFQSHTEGARTSATGNASHAEGNCTLAINQYEHAQGQFNKPHKVNTTFGDAGNTLNSIGIGTSDSDRKNAVEVMQNGDVYVYGVGDYDGTNPTTADTLQDAITDIQEEYPNMISVTYAELYDLFENSNLVPGQQYRITDYECVTTKEDTHSAGNQFDIIVVADSENALNENARAIQHTTSNQDYFHNCDLAAWKLKYSLLGDINRFDWCPNGQPTKTMTYIPGPGQQTITIGVYSKTADYWVWGAPREGYVYTHPNPEVGSPVYTNSDLSGSTLMYITDLYYTVGNKGVIYYMKDEWANEAPYDFKNILFERSITEGGVFDPEGVTTSNVYTFTAYDKTLHIINDASVIPYYLVVGCQCYGNTIKELPDGDSNYTKRICLSNNVFLNTYINDSVTGQGFICYDNTLDRCGNNTFGNNCYSNSFGNNCYDNSFGDDSCDNSFGNYCSDNSFGNNCISNSFGDYFYSNSFGDDFCNNSFGDNCSDNSFGDNFSDNSFGDNCNSNSFGDNCYSNSFGDYCSSNSFGDSCGNNSFGNSCYSMSFGDSFNSNTFGDDCWDSEFGNYIRHISVFNGVTCCTVTGGSSDESFVQNAQILNGVHGESETWLTITFAEDEDCTQIAALRDGSGTPAQRLDIWIATEKVDKVPTATENNIALFNASGGIKDTGVSASSFAGLSHTHGNIQNGGTLQTNDITIANGDKLVVTDASDGNKIARASISFDGSTTTKALTKKGTFETFLTSHQSLPEYTIEKLGTAESGYIASYILKKNGTTQEGATINIPKDYLVKSGSIVNVVLYNGHYYESTDTGHTTQLDAYGVNAAGKYLKFVVNTVDGTGNTSSIYISVQDLVDAYQAGNGISIDASNYISVKIDSANANGLATTTAGLKLNTVTTTANGAMLATDKVKLDSINGNYWGSQTLSAAANYITTPEFKQVTINGSTTNAASTDHCIMVYDTTNKCVKFTF